MTNLTEVLAERKSVASLAQVDRRPRAREKKTPNGWTRGNGQRKKAGGEGRNGETWVDRKGWVSIDYRLTPEKEQALMDSNTAYHFRPLPEPHPIASTPREWLKRTAATPEKSGYANDRFEVRE